jgi:CBS domain containing-hemolysin-like protein
MDTGSTLLRLGAIVVLIAANAFFVAAEFALVASRRTRIEAMIRRGDRKAKTVRVALADLSRQLSAAQLGITVASILLGYVAEETLAEVVRHWLAALPPALAFATRAGVAAVLAVSAISVLHVVVGEQAPKAWAIMYPEATSRWVAGPLITFSWLTRPVTGSLNWAANRIVRLMGISTLPQDVDRIHSPEEIRMLVEQSHRAGQLEKGDARMLAGVFEFSEKNAREVMTPRTAIVALPQGATLAQAADRIAAAGRSRYPVVRDSLDDITGIVHAKDVLAALRREGEAAALAPLLRPAHFVPGSREIEDVLADMKLRKVHMVIVLDEFGGTAGLVTMEDLLEEIVGQIEDEYDRPRVSTAAPAAGAAPPPALFPGYAAHGEVNEKCALALASGDYTTLGGFLFGALGRLPRVGDRVQVKGGAFEVVAMDGRRIGEARFVRGARS